MSKLSKIVSRLPEKMEQTIQKKFEDLPKKLEVNIKNKIKIKDKAATVINAIAAFATSFGLLYSMGIFSYFEPEINLNGIYLVPATASGTDALNLLIPISLINKGEKGATIKKINLQLIRDGKPVEGEYEATFEINISKFISIRCLKADVMQNRFLPFRLEKNSQEIKNLLFINGYSIIGEGNYTIKMEVETTDKEIPKFNTETSFKIAPATKNSFLEGKSLLIAERDQVTSFEPSTADCKEDKNNY